MAVSTVVPLADSVEEPGFRPASRADLSRASAAAGKQPAMAGSLRALLQDGKRFVGIVRPAFKLEAPAGVSLDAIHPDDLLAPGLERGIRTAELVVCAVRRRVRVIDEPGIGIGNGPHGIVQLLPPAKAFLWILAEIAGKWLPECDGRKHACAPREVITKEGDSPFHLIPFSQTKPGRRQVEPGAIPPDGDRGPAGIVVGGSGKIREAWEGREQGQNDEEKEQRANDKPFHGWRRSGLQGRLANRTPAKRRVSCMEVVPENEAYGSTNRAGSRRNHSLLNHPLRSRRTYPHIVILSEGT